MSSFYDFHKTEEFVGRKSFSSIDLFGLLLMDSFYRMMISAYSVIY